MNMKSRITGENQANSSTRRLGRVGIWSAELRYGDPGQIVDAAAELDDLGFGALWVPGGTGGDLLNDVSRLLSATRKATVATGILNIWMHDAHDVSVWWHKLSADHRGRFLLGLGVSHSAVVGAYRNPLSAMKDYLTRLSNEGLSANDVCLAALGPKMLELARDRTAGAHPYLVTPEHTAVAREALGPVALLAPEQGVVPESNPTRAREFARPYVKGYGALANYANNWLRLGFTEEDIANTSDRLVDALFAWGGADRIAERVNAHLNAGADHVCLQVVGARTSPDVGAIRPAWRELAAALL
jgi:probable F420-dependent oxidoreductase